MHLFTNQGLEELSYLSKPPKIIYILKVFDWISTIWCILMGFDDHRRPTFRRAFVLCRGGIEGYTIYNLHFCFWNRTKIILLWPFQGVIFFRLMSFCSVKWIHKNWGIGRMGNRSRYSVANVKCLDQLNQEALLMLKSAK